jgi:hypothetical protein
VADAPPSLRIGDVTASLPIIQGGMGVGVSLSGLASAVANAGGIGVIACAGIGMTEPDMHRNFEPVDVRPRIDPPGREDGDRAPGGRLEGPQLCMRTARTASPWR